MKRLVAWLLPAVLLLPPTAHAAFTVVINSRESFGGMAVNFVTLTWDSSYGTGGDAITAALCGVSEIDEMVVLVDNAGWTFQFDKSALKIMAFGAPDDDWSDASLAATDTVALWDEADATTNLSSVATRAIVFGKP